MSLIIPGEKMPKNAVAAHALMISTLTRMAIMNTDAILASAWIIGKHRAKKIKIAHSSKFLLRMGG